MITRILILLLCIIKINAKQVFIAPRTILINETHPYSEIRKTIGILTLTRGTFYPELTKNMPMWAWYYDGPTKCSYVRFPKIHEYKGKKVLECEDFAVREWEIPRDICKARLLVNPNSIDNAKLNITFVFILMFIILSKLPDN